MRNNQVKVGKVERDLVKIKGGVVAESEVKRLQSHFRKLYVLTTYRID